MRMDPIWIESGLIALSINETTTWVWPLSSCFLKINLL